MKPPESTPLRAALGAAILIGLLPDASVNAQVFQTAGGGAPEPLGILFTGLQLDVPDNSAVGVVSEQIVDGLESLIAFLEVRLVIEGRSGEPAFNGDLMVTLSHDSGYSVLLNRPGRRAGDLSGYGDSGFDVTFSDAAAGDVHTYRISLTGSHTVPLSITEAPAPLTGTWRPDGRAVDPSAVLDTTPSTAGLGSFVGLDPNGRWTLHVTDHAEGGLSRVTEWGLVITPVPEPQVAAAWTGILLLGAAFVRRLASRA